MATPADLGVHASITVDGDTTLTRIPRPHDRQLRNHLTRAKAYSGPTLILVVGTSCTGKTRTLYEAVTTVLPDWQLTAPRSDRDLARLLLLGIPAHTVVWLDDEYNRIPSTPDGVNATRDILELIRTTGIGPILFVGTIWPTTLDHVSPTYRILWPQLAPGPFRIKLVRATVNDVPECFAAADLTDLTGRPSPSQSLRDRLRTTDPVGGINMDQVLAGATQLIQRLHPPPGIHQTDEFSPAAKAVLYAAGDFGRVGMPNPIPRWAIEGTDPAYHLKIAPQINGSNVLWRRRLRPRCWMTASPAPEPSTSITMVSGPHPLLDNRLRRTFR